jgi:hypothetical protein
LGIAAVRVRQSSARAGLLIISAASSQSRKSEIEGEMKRWSNSPPNRKANLLKRARHCDFRKPAQIESASYGDLAKQVKSLSQRMQHSRTTSLFLIAAGAGKDDAVAINRSNLNRTMGESLLCRCKGQRPWIFSHIELVQCPAG